MVDGVVESETASLHEPYCGCSLGGHHNPHSPIKRKNKAPPKLTRSSSLLNTDASGHRGVTNFDRDSLIRIVELLDKEGFQVRHLMCG